LPAFPTAKTRLPKAKTKTGCHKSGWKCGNYFR
jgi:hypothetical protein